MVNWNDKDSINFEIIAVALIFAVASAMLLSFMLVFRPDLLIITIFGLGLVALIIIGFYAIEYRNWRQNECLAQNPRIKRS